MRSKQEYGLIFKVGSKCIELLDKQDKEQNEKKEKWIERQQQIQILSDEQQQLELKKQALPEEKKALLKSLMLEQQTSSVIPQYDTNYDLSKLTVCRTMLNAALDSKICVFPEKVPFSSQLTSPLSKFTNSLQVLSQAEIDKTFNLCLQSIQDLNHLNQFATELQQRGEFKYVEMLTQKTITQITEFLKAAEDRTFIQQQLQQLLNEQYELQQQRKQLTGKITRTKMNTFLFFFLGFLVSQLK